MILLLPFYLEDYLGFDQQRAGMILVLSPLLTLVAAPLSGSLADRFGPKLPALAGFVTGAAGFALIAGPGLHGALRELGIGLALLGVAGGFFNSPVISAMMNSAGTADRAYASSFNSLARNLGFVSGTTLGSMLLMQFLGHYGPQGEQLQRLARQAPLAQVVPLEAFRYAASGVFWVCTALCVALALLYLRYPSRVLAADGSAAG
jgi:MFS family permease